MGQAENNGIKKSILTIKGGNQRIADKAGIAIAQTHGPYPMAVEEYPEVHEYLLTVVEKMCAICELLECPYLIIHPMVVRNRKEEWERNMEMYRKHGMIMFSKN